MKLFLAICFFFMSFVVCGTHAQTNDDNIVIDRITETYTYTTSAGSLRLVEQSKAEYRCLKWPETISVATFYDNSSEVKNVFAKVSRKISPNYEMYQKDGIFYSDVKVCYFNLPFTKKEETAMVNFEKVHYDITLFTEILLFEPQYVKQKTVEIVIPFWMSVDIVEENIGSNIEKSESVDPKSGTVTHVYTIKNQEAVKWQADGPGYYRTAPYLIIVPRKSSLKGGEISFFNDYDDVYRWCKQKIDMTVNDKEAVSVFTQQIVAGCHTEEEKKAEIFAWVQNNIRYLAFLYGLAGWVPDQAQSVMQKKYGDCKGMSNLLKEMLCSVGIDARRVWIGTNRIYSGQEIPLPLFDHMICAVFKDGAVTYLDPTNKYMVIGEYHEAIQGRPTMIEDGDGYIVGRVPQVPVSQNTDSLYCTYRIDGNSLVGEVSMTMSGESKQNILSRINALESSRRINVLKQFLEKGRPQDKVSEISVEGIDSRKNTLHINYKDIRNGSINRIGNEIFVEMDTRKDFAFSQIDTIQHKSDINFRYCELTIREEYLEIPDGYQVISLPKNLHIDNNNYRIDVAYHTIGNKIRYRKEIEIMDIWLKKENFTQWNNDINSLKKNYMEQIILKRTDI